MHVAFLGLGLIGGSVARALRASPGRGGGTLAGAIVAAGRRMGEVPRHALDATACDAAPSVPAAAAARRGPGDPRGAAGRVRGLLARLGCGLVDRYAPARGRRSPTSRPRRPPHPRGGARSAAVPFVGGHPMAGRETSGFAAADADLFRDRPWVIVPSRSLATTRWSGDARPGVRRQPVRPRRPRARHARRRDQPPAARSPSVALVEAVAGTGPEPRRTGRGRRRSRPAAGHRRRASPAATRRWGRTSPPRTPPAIAARLRDLRAVIDEWLALLEAPRRPGRVDAPRARLAAARRPPRRRTRGRPGRAGPGRPARARSCPGDGWLGVRRDGLDGRARGRGARGVLPAPRRRRGGPDAQAGDPVPRAARRRALVPHAAHEGRRRRAPPRPAGRSASAGTSTRATATWPAASAASGPRSWSPTSCPTSSRSACSTTTRRRSARSTWASCSSRTPAVARSRSARRTSWRGRSLTTEAAAAVRDGHGDLEPARLRRADASDRRPRGDAARDPSDAAVPYSTLVP